MERGRHIVSAPGIFRLPPAARRARPHPPAPFTNLGRGDARDWRQRVHARQLLVLLQAAQQLRHRRRVEPRQTGGRAALVGHATVDLLHRRATGLVLHAVSPLAEAGAHVWLELELGVRRGDETRRAQGEQGEEEAHGFFT